MKILLISCPVMDYVNGRLKPIAMDAGHECAPYGIYLLSSILKQADNDVILADLVASGSHDIQPYLSDIEDCSLIGISATTLSWPIAVMIIEQIRQAGADVPIVLGGIHPSMFDKVHTQNVSRAIYYQGRRRTRLARPLRGSGERQNSKKYS